MSEALRAQQFALARHLRDPAAHPPPAGIEDRRLAIYRDLFYNNIEGLLAANFPVIRRTLNDGDWHAQVRAFCVEHRCRTPLFTEIGREFVRYLQTRAEDPQAQDPPWLAELAHYEWIELDLQIADDPVPAHDPAGDLLDGQPARSPWLRLLAYQWPVHHLGPGHTPDTPPPAPTLLLLRRDPQGDVRFAEISPLVYRLLQCLETHPGHSGRAVLTMLAAEAGVAAEDLLPQGHAMLQRLHVEGTLLGTRPD